MAKLIKKADPRETNKIELGKDPYTDELYGCFRFDNPKAEPFATEREVEIIARSGQNVSVSVPEELKITLQKDVKAVNTDAFTLNEIDGALDSMLLLTMRAGWNQNETDITRMIRLDPKGSFVARIQGDGFNIPVATSSTLPLGKNNTWIGMILVHPELRRQGIANAMMQHCLKYAIDSGKIINGLDATPMGNTVYGAVGYVNSYRIWRSFFQLDEFSKAQEDTNHVSRMSESDLRDVILYDASRFLEREQIMTELFKDSDNGCFVFRDDNGAVKGFCYTRPGRIRPFVGPFTADSEEIAGKLIVSAAKHLIAVGNSDGTAFIDTPEDKFDNPGVYEQKVFDQKNKPSGHRLISSIVPVRDFTRMYQLVNDEKVEPLVEAFMKAEKLDKNSKRVDIFRETMAKSVYNYTETLGFMQFEKNELQKRFWGITGPEKG